MFTKHDVIRLNGKSNPPPWYSLKYDPLASNDGCWGAESRGIEHHCMHCLPPIGLKMHMHGDDRFHP